MHEVKFDTEAVKGIENGNRTATGTEGSGQATGPSRVTGETDGEQTSRPAGTAASGKAVLRNKGNGR